LKDLSGKVAVVTGGASGIGKALATRFLQGGLSVMLGDVEAGPLDQTLQELATLGPVAGLVTDVTDPMAVEALATATRDRYGAYHVVCNNAGVGGHFGLTWETPLEEWRWLFDVNIWGVIHGIRTFVPALIAQGEGHVVNTASLAGWMAAASMGPYAATKHAVLAISESLRGELEAIGSGVGVTAVCPGMINTKIISSERNWPESLGPEPVVPQPPVVAAVRRILLDGTTQGDVEPSAVAEAVWEGIVSNRPVVSTHPGQLVGAARARLAQAETVPTVAGD
jgi:NAD(P)-dependent dehydrogenase (short-subunit alcohol dehydrogenase family)